MKITKDKINRVYAEQAKLVKLDKELNTVFESTFMGDYDSTFYDAISVGDKVISSSVSDRYMYGLTIGYVSSVSYDTNNLTQTAEIVPTVNFNDIKDVLVIVDRKQEVNY